MTGYESIGKPWVSSRGELRFYVNDWMDMIDLDVEYYNTGNVCYVAWHGEKMSNSWFKRYVAGTKVWIGEDGQVHVDYCNRSSVESEIREALTARIAALEVA